MSHAGRLLIHTDGASRGNPGPAAFAYVIQQDGMPPIEGAGCLGKMTNNQAEYTALVRALEHAAELGGRPQIELRSDSELMVKQMNGEYRVKDETLRPLYEEARALLHRLGRVEFVHVRRGSNKRADELCNEALDGERDGRKADPGPPKEPKKRAKTHAAAARQEQARAEAIACLEVAAGAWMRRDAGAPTPGQVWEQLWSILEEHRVVS